ncbi:hypothetical protein ACC692_37780, partial [Rhizobium ruizarguesonis]
ILPENGTKNGFVQLSLRNAIGEAIRQSNSSKSAFRFCVRNCVETKRAFPCFEEKWKGSSYA